MEEYNGMSKRGENNRQKVPKCGSNGVGKEGEIGGKRGAKDVKKWVRTEGEKGGNEREQTRCHIGGKRIGKKWVTCGE